jgi:hypothetical protein
MRNILFTLSMLSAATLNAATGAAPAVDDLSRAIRNFQDLDSWKAIVSVDFKGKTATLKVTWNGSQMMMDATTLQGKHYNAMFEKGKSFLSADGGKTWEADSTRVAEQQLHLIMAPAAWDGKGTPQGKYDWAGMDTVDGERTVKIAGNPGLNARPSTYWMYNHPKYGMTLKKSVVDFEVNAETIFKITTVFSEPFNKNPHPAK